MRKLRLFRVIRPLTSPKIISVFALNKEDAEEIVTKKYGPDFNIIRSIRIKRGLCLEEALY